MVSEITEYGKSEQKLSRRFKALIFLAQEEELGRVLGPEWIEWKNARKAALKAAVKANKASK